MKILIFGRGVIATQYAWALEHAGNTVEFYVRNGRAAEYGPSVKVELLDGRTNLKGDKVQEAWPVVFREDLPHDHDYDLIIVSVNHPQFAGAVEFLAPRIGAATLLVFNNFWVDPEAAVAMLPQDQIVWGFPGAGGGVGPDGAIRGALFKLVFFGKMKVPKHSVGLTDRDRAVRDLFRSTGFKIIESGDFKRFLWFHFLMDAAVGIQTIKAGGLLNVMDSPREIKGAVVLFWQLVKVLKARGMQPGFLAKSLRLVPPGFLAWLIYKTLFRRGLLTRRAMDFAAESFHGKEGMLDYPRDVLLEARRLNVHVPQLESVAAQLGV